MVKKLTRFLRGTTALSLSALFAAMPFSVAPKNNGAFKMQILKARAAESLAGVDLAATSPEELQAVIDELVRDLAIEGLKPEEIVRELVKQIAENLAANPDLPAEKMTQALSNVLGTSSFNVREPDISNIDIPEPEPAVTLVAIDLAETLLAELEAIVAALVAEFLADGAAPDEIADALGGQIAENFVANPGFTVEAISAALANVAMLLDDQLESPASFADPVKQSFRVVAEAADDLTEDQRRVLAILFGELIEEEPPLQVVTAPPLPTPAPGTGPDAPDPDGEGEGTGGGTGGDDGTFDDGGDDPGGVY